MNTLDEYIANLKQKLEENFFSPQFVRLANLYYLNHKYEDCIRVCKTGLEIFPDYLTAKLILLRALIKVEYLGEAETIYGQIENRIQNLEINEIMKNKIDSLKRNSIQERIYYTDASGPDVNFDEYGKTLADEFPASFNIALEDYLNKKSGFIIDKSKFDVFVSGLEKFRFGQANGKGKSYTGSQTSSPDKRKGAEIFSNIKIVSETLADIYAKQGNFKEAFNMYNFLIRAGSPNKSRLESKLNQLEHALVKMEDH